MPQKQHVLGARLRRVLPWVVLLALALSRGGALRDAARRNLANRPFLVAAMSASGEAMPLPDNSLAVNGFQARALAAVAREQGRPAEALSWLTAGLAAADPNDLTRFEACRLYLDQGQIAEARTACGHTPATTAYWITQGIAADEGGRVSEAIAYFDMARTADPNLLAAWERLGHVYLQAERPAEAVAIYEHLLRAQARPLADSYTQLGAAYTALDRLDDARAVLEQGLEHYPFQRELLLAVADNARATGDLAAADGWYDQLLAQRPEDAYAWARRGELALERGQTRQAVDYLERATSIEPAAVGYWLGLAGAADAANDIGRATLAYDQALVLRPSDVGVQLAAVRFFARSGQPAKARAAYHRILALAPDGSEAAEALAALTTEQVAP